MVSEACIELWPIDKLVFYAGNPRKNDAAVDRICGSISEFGFKIPVLVRSDGEVVDGHLRLKAARKLGINEIPVLLCDEGSGTTLAAAELTERVCCGIELDPKYVDVIVQRWQALSSKTTKLDGDGRSSGPRAAIECSGGVRSEFAIRIPSNADCSTGR